MKLPQKTLREAVEHNQGIRRDKLMALLGVELAPFNTAKRTASDRGTLFIQKKGGWTHFYTMVYAIENAVVANVSVRNIQPRRGISRHSPKEEAHLKVAKTLDALWR